MNKNSSCNVLCTNTLGTSEIDTFLSYIKHGYNINWCVRSSPRLTFVFNGDNFPRSEPRQLLSPPAIPTLVARFRQQLVPLRASFQLFVLYE
jgi:hypothetical protein